MARSGLKRITISTVDKDIVVISLYIFFDLNVDELWIEYGVSTRKKWIPVHSYANEFGEENCRALPFWYCFTGCDTVSQFGGRGKKTAWEVWRSYPHVTETFNIIIRTL